MVHKPVDRGSYDGLHAMGVHGSGLLLYGCSTPWSDTVFDISCIGGAFLWGMSVFPGPEGENSHTSRAEC